MENIYEHYSFVVDSGQAPIRLDKWLLIKTKNITRSKIQKAAKLGLLTVNGKQAKSSYKIKPGDNISLKLPYPPKTELIAEDISIKIVYEDEEVIVVDKPQGMVVHPASGNPRGTLMNAVLYYVRNKYNINWETSNLRPGLAHRIDKGTSGLLVIAKNEQTLQNLYEQFKAKTTKRVYYAFVWGNVKQDKGTINANLGRSRTDRKKYAVLCEGGKVAITHYEVVLRFPTATLVKCVLETGRTHQIRVHMKHLGHVLFGDEVYGGNKIVIRQPSNKYKRFIYECLQIMPTQALHARTLGFKHPEGFDIHITSPLPENFKLLLQKFSEYYETPLPEEVLSDEYDIKIGNR